jgi:uncharacterized protein (TIGR02678 family)
MKAASQGFGIISNLEEDTERRLALRALLRNPLLQASGDSSEMYALVRRHSESLQQWLTTYPAWSLHISREFARLRKMPAGLPDDTRSAIDRGSGAHFTKHRYALLCLTLAALEQMDRQTTLGQLAQTIMELLAVDPDLKAAGLSFDSGNYDQRRDLVRAVRFLLDNGVLRKIDGDQRQPGDRDSEDALFDINRHVLAEMLQATHSPSAIEMAAQQSSRQQEYSASERAAILNDDPVPSSQELRQQWTRSRLVRTLLDDPVLYFHDLNDEERDYLEKHRGTLLREICDATGLIAEVRREGIALIDAARDLTDLKLPDQGPENHLSLLLVQWFAECFKTRTGEIISIAEVDECVRDLVRRHRSEWRGDIHEAGVNTRLTEDVLLRIRSLRLIQVSADGIVPLAASCRYASSEIV